MANLTLVQSGNASIAKAAMPPGMVIRSLEDVITIAKILAASHFFKDADTEAKAAAKILRGWELGIPPVAALENVHVIDGKTSLSVHLIASKIDESGRYRKRIVSANKDGCNIAFHERVDGSWEELGTSEFTIADAQAANLLSKKNWQQYTRAMLYARALAQGARWYCSSVFMGQVYVPDELGAETDEDGAVIDTISSSVIYKTNSEQLADLLTELGVTDTVQRKQVAQKHLKGKKAADLSADELEEVLSAIRQDLSPKIPEPVAEAPSHQPVDFGEAVVAPHAIALAENTPDPVDNQPVAVTVTVPHPPPQSFQSNRDALSSLLDELEIEEYGQRQKLVKTHLRGRKVENLTPTELFDVLLGIRNAAKSL